MYKLADLLNYDQEALKLTFNQVNSVRHLLEQTGKQTDDLLEILKHIDVEGTKKYGEYWRM